MKVKKIKILLLSLALSIISTFALADTKILMQTSMGNIEIELDTKNAPITTKNFLEYVNSGYYDGLVFHRVIPNFMIQGGGADDKLNFEATNPPIKNEAKNDLRNDRGTIAMARTSSVDSATSQFFINVVDNNFLNYKSADDYGYAVFGKVTDGMDVVDQIVNVKTTRRGPHQNVPMEPVYITKVTVIE